MPQAQGERVVPGLFIRSVTRAVLRAACREQGLDDAGAVLLRHGENAVYRLVLQR